MMTQTTPPSLPLDFNQAIILTDTHCPFCLWWIQWLLKRDVKHNFSIAPLHMFFSKPETLVVITKTGIYTRGKAIIQLLKRLPYPWKLLGHFLSFFPGFFLDLLYRFVAKNRYHLSQMCKLMDLLAYQERLASPELLKKIKSFLELASIDDLAIIRRSQIAC